VNVFYAPNNGIDLAFVMQGNLRKVLPSCMPMVFGYRNDACGHALIEANRISVTVAILMLK